ncbi:hypothetical protein CNYM01_14369 [Colletotrichum nymphaeae SA-01]|uniref:Uncharacterized protein n=1 Tax=Colletotrichum nymphaeae SA-01 TaxID=1460502 RepID=A0A135USL9_9PEZI|nr:hypothetical protein CNYM01_14369 [Colletotrichum nymphaeae SA-01]
MQHHRQEAPQPVATQIALQMWVSVVSCARVNHSPDSDARLRVDRASHPSSHWSSIIVPPIAYGASASPTRALLRHADSCNLARKPTAISTVVTPLTTSTRHCMRKFGIPDLAKINSHVLHILVLHILLQHSQTLSNILSKPSGSNAFSDLNRVSFDAHCGDADT